MAQENTACASLTWKRPRRSTKAARWPLPKWSSLPDGHCEINLALPWTASSQSHFSITLLDKANSLVHPGDSKRAIKIAEIAFR